MILGLGEETAIAFVCARWNLRLLRPAHPSNRVVVGPSATRALKAGLALLGFFAEELALIHRGSVHRVVGPAKAGHYIRGPAKAGHYILRRRPESIDQGPADKMGSLGRASVAEPSVRAASSAAAPNGGLSTHDPAHRRQPAGVDREHQPRAGDGSAPHARPSGGRHRRS